jgi:hypothetical protein
MTATISTPAGKMAERFERDTASHQMTVMHDDGLYRHLRFKRPEQGAYWFDLITWPGNLAITGDCGSFTFARITDMFEFFRGDRINPQYWAEKVQAADRSGVTAYRPEMFRQLVTEYAQEVESDWPGLAAAVQKRILGDLREWDIEYEEGAREALRDFDHQPEGQTGEPFTFTDAWEWDLRDYHWQFLWCLHAIQRGIGQYDAQKVAVDA